MATIIPPRGRDGVIILGVNHLYLDEWSFNFDLEVEPYAHFELDFDVNDLNWKPVMTGYVTGQATVRGKLDTTPGEVPFTDKGLWMDQFGVGFLGYTSAVGFEIGYHVTNISGSHSADALASASKVEVQLRITACEFVTNYA
jgi:hypothetical protein